MKWASAIASTLSARSALEAAAREVRAVLGPDRPDLALVFASPHYSKEYARLPALLAEAVPAKVVAGCSALGVLGGGRETEDEPAMAVMAAHLPDVRVVAVHLLGPELPDADHAPDAWASCLGLEPSARPHFLVLGDPFCPAVSALLDGLDFAYPDAAALGALASGAGRPGGNALWLNDQCHRDGLVVLALEGDVAVDPIVFQSCRPIGDPVTVTCADRNLLLEVDGAPPLEWLRRLFPTMPAGDQDLARYALFVGIRSEAPLDSAAPPGYLMRTVLGVDANSGAMALAEPVLEGARVQFHVRDRLAAVDELDRLLGAYARRRPPRGGEGLLLFPCMGRGRHLFGVPGLETGRVRAHLGELPVGGFFCNGEIGPSGAGVSLHSYSSVLGVVRPASAGRAGERP